MDTLLLPHALLDTRDTFVCYWYLDREYPRQHSWKGKREIYVVLWTLSLTGLFIAQVWPIMGAGYHTIHHTNYKTNYGHYFVFFDQLFGTLQTPSEEEHVKAQ